MHFRGIYTPEQLAMLSKVMDDYCRDHFIERPGPGYEDASYLVLALWKDGARNVDQLKAALDTAIAGTERRQT